MIFLLELGKNVTNSSHRHIIFLGSAWNEAGFEYLAGSGILDSSHFALDFLFLFVLLPHS